MRLALAMLALLAAAIALPLATAHSTVISEDGRLRIVVGQLDEPVVTHAKSGLDLCFQHNTAGREPETGVEASRLNATLVAPGGQRLSDLLTEQFGRPGCFQFIRPYVLTQPGQYLVDLSGDANGTRLDVTGILAGGAVVDAGTLAFPDANATLAALRERVDALESSNASRGAAGPGALLALAAVALVAAVRRR